MIYEAERGDIRMVAMGDTMLTCKLAPYKEPDYLRLVELVRSADVSFANLETTVRNREEGYTAAGITGAGSIALAAPTTTTLGGVKSLVCTGTQKLSSITAAGLPVCTADANSGGTLTSVTAGAGNGGGVEVWDVLSQQGGSRGRSETFCGERVLDREGHAQEGEV